MEEYLAVLHLDQELLGTQQVVKYQLPNPKNIYIKNRRKNKYQNSTQKNVAYEHHAPSSTIILVWVWLIFFSHHLPWWCALFPLSQDSYTYTLTLFFKTLKKDRGPLSVCDLISGGGGSLSLPPLAYLRFSMCLVGYSSLATFLSFFPF